MFQFPILCQGCFVWHYSYIWLTELGFRFIMCCAREEEENVVFLSLYLSSSWALPFSYFLWDMGGCRWVLWGWNCGVLCLSSHSKVAARHHCKAGSAVFPVLSLSAQALTCKVLVNSKFLQEQLCGKAASLSKLILHCSDCFAFLKGRGGGTFVSKPVKLFRLDLRY